MALSVLFAAEQMDGIAGEPIGFVELRLDSDEHVAWPCGGARRFR